jgi:hypothetical protein
VWMNGSAIENDCVTKRVQANKLQRDAALVATLVKHVDRMVGNQVDRFGECARNLGMLEAEVRQTKEWLDLSVCGPPNCHYERLRSSEEALLARVQGAVNVGDRDTTLVPGVPHTPVLHTHAHTCRRVPHAPHSHTRTPVNTNSYMCGL